MGKYFEMDKKYEIIDSIGHGAYGIVVAAKDTSQPDQNLVAVKQIIKAFEHRIYTKSYSSFPIKHIVIALSSLVSLLTPKITMVDPDKVAV